MTHLALFTVLCLLVCCGAQAQTLHVAPHGDDAAPGTQERPFASLAGARDAIRRVAGDRPATVIVANGTYELTESFVLAEEDSGTPDAPITYRAEDDRQVRLVGGRELPADAFTPIADPAVLDRLDPSARDHVLQLDLASVGVAGLAPPPVRYRGAPDVPELFLNGQRMTLARWPNQGWTTIGKIIESGSRPRDGDMSNRPGIFEYTGDRADRWDADAGVWLQGYWCYDWYEETIKVGAIDGGTRRITLAEPHLYSVMQGNPSPRRYRAINLLAELDAPGEYYVDPATGTLYFRPPGDLAGARLMLSMLKEPVVSLTGVSHVGLRGFIIEACRGDAVTVTDGSNVQLLGCIVRNARERGIAVTGGTGHRIEACDIHDTGTGGVVLSGGDRRALTPGGHEIVNCHIHHFSEHQLTYANAIMLSGVGNRAAHCLIHDAPHQAIGVAGNDHIFELNVIHHVCMETDDCGAYYKGRNPSCRGNIVRHNFWHNIGSPMGHGNAAVYFDDGDGGDFVIGNVFFRCGEPGRGSFGTVFSHGGHDLLAENNIFVECKRALGSAPWNDDRWKAAIDGGLDCFFQQKLLEEVDITKPPYTTRYPALVGFMDPQPGAPRVSQGVRNLLVMCGEVRSGNWQVSDEENWVTDEDPGFVDAAGGDFALREDAAVFEKLPGFQPIPFAEMGLYIDDLRPTLPVEEWTYDPPKPLVDTP